MVCLLGVGELDLCVLRLTIDGCNHTKPYYELLKSFLCNTGLITFSIYVSRDIYLGIAY